MRTLGMALLAAGVLAAQPPQVLDALEFTLPAGPWRTEAGTDHLRFHREVAEGGCRILVTRTAPSGGSLAQDAEGDWGRLLQSHPRAARGQVRTLPAGEGWTFTQQIGSAREGGREVLLSVHTFTGHGQRQSVFFESTHAPFDDLLNQFINASRLRRPAAAPAVAGQPAGLVGQWRRAQASYSHWGLAFTLGELSKLGSQGYTEWLYDFQPGGTYTFVRKTWPMSGSRILYLKESGSYRLEPGAVTLVPSRSVSEAWTKREDDKDAPGRLEVSENHPLVPTRYRTAWHFWSGQGEWNLVLMAEPETRRDGSYHGGGPYPRGWYYKPAPAGARVK